MACQGCDEIEIYVRSSKETKQLKIPENTTVKELKSETAKHFRISPENMKLIFAGKYLKDFETLIEKNIRNDFTVFLMIKPVIQQKDEHSRSQQEGLPPEAVPELEFRLDFESAILEIFYSLPFANLRTLSVWRQEVLRVLDEIHGQMSTVLSAVFNPEILRSFNLQNLNDALFQDILRFMGEIAGSVMEIIDKHESLETYYKDVLGPFLNIDCQNLLSNREALIILVEIAETPALHLDARITSMLYVFSRYPELQELPVDNLGELIKYLIGTQALLEQVDMAITSAAGNTNTLPSEASTTSINSTTIMSNLNVPAIVNESPNENQYRLQLEELENMGFSNREENLQALIARYGNVIFAVDMLLKTAQNAHETD